MLPTLRNRNLSARLRQPADEYWDRRLGISTFGYHPGSGAPGEREWYMHYSPTPYRDLFEILAMARLGDDDIFTDLGCGLGRAVFAASHRGARRAEGVELVPALARNAEQNRNLSRLAERNIAFFERNALDHDLSATTLLYMFHSFGGQIIAEILDKAKRDRRKTNARKPLRIAYVNPVCEEALRASDWLRHVGVRPAKRQWLSNALHYPTAFWESTDC